MTAAGESTGGEVARSAVESVIGDKPGHCSSVYVKSLFSHKELISLLHRITTAANTRQRLCVGELCENSAGSLQACREGLKEKENGLPGEISLLPG